MRTKRNTSHNRNKQGKENQVDVVRPDSLEPVAAEAPRGCDGSPLAREGLPLGCVGEEGIGDLLVCV